MIKGRETTLGEVTSSTTENTQIFGDGDHSKLRCVHF